uniref:Histone deacetylase n=1 Tax=Physcomitrium patens TaxID=3218 RepID=A0A7I4AMP3_PHYPA
MFVVTAVAVGEELDDRLPHHEYYEYFGPDYSLHVAPSNMANQNSKKDIDNLRMKLLENLSKLQHVPSVPFSERPPDTELPENEDEDLELRDKGRTWDGELSDSDSEDHDLRRRNQGVFASETAFPRPPPLGSTRGKSEEEIGEAMSSDDEIDMEDEARKGPEDTKDAAEEHVEMDVDPAVEAGPEDETPSNIEMGGAPQAEQADTSAGAAPAVAVAPPTTTTNVDRESSVSTAAPFLLHPSPSSTTAAVKPAASSSGRVTERSTVAPAATNFNQSNSFGGAPSFTQRSYVPPQPSAGSNMPWRQSQPGNHAKTSNQSNNSHSLPQAGVPLGIRAGPPSQAGGGASVPGSGSGILSRSSGNPVLPPGRPGAPGPGSYSARPAGPTNRFASTINPGANLGEPAQTDS